MVFAVRPAAPALSPHVRPVPFKVTTPYVRLLASAPDAHGMEAQHGCPMLNMVMFMRALLKEEEDKAKGGKCPHTEAYRRLLAHYEFASEARLTQENAVDLGQLTWTLPFLLVVPASRLILKHLAKRALRRVHTMGSVLLPCFTDRHAMYIQIDLTANGTYTLRIFNTGDGLDHQDGRPRHCYRGDDKWQTMYIVRNVRGGEGPGCLNIEQLTRMLRAPVVKIAGLKTVDDLYAWADALGTPYNPPHYALQALQKSGSCTHKSILAVARNCLTDAAYCELLARLREQTYAQYMSRDHRVDKQPLIDLFAQRTVSARQKADGAARQAALRTQHARDAWMVESVDRPAMDRALATARERHGKAFLLSYRDDTHRLALSVANSRGIGHMALLPRPEGLVTPRATYADLDAVARAWSARGYKQIGRAEVAAASPEVQKGCLAPF